ncbi:hypothetical protein ACFP9V_00915 [Deinococcus radiopugnans]|uniref:hypothetical protein n=1 Tax=Deinococcus radiopugnans TaxID=57497 RepID=UPI0036078C54
MSILELRKVWGNRPLVAAAIGVLLQDETGRVLLQRRGDDGLWGNPAARWNPARIS